MKIQTNYQKKSVNHLIRLLGVSLLLIVLIRCQKDEQIPTLTVTPTEIAVAANGGSSYFTIKTNASSWQIANPNPDEIKLSDAEGSSSEEIVVIKVLGKTLSTRNDKLIVTAGKAEPVEVTVKQPSSEYLYELSSDQLEFNFKANQMASSFTLSSTAPEWTITNPLDWITLSQLNGGEGETEIQISVDNISDFNDRSGTLLITADATNTIELSVSQFAGLYPNYNVSPLEPDQSGMERNATQIASDIKIGWNIGNTLEAIGGETAWGNPKVTKELIQLVKDNGFNAIRIPCSWNQYVEDVETAKIKSVWLDRVKEVVQYCVDNEMYALLNIHWDGGWLENNCTLEAQYANNAKQKAFWQQIATHLRDFDEHLLFAGANEPNVEDETQMNVLMSYHQTFVDAVRSTGGKNAYRVLVVQGPSTDIDKTNQLMTVMPNDELADRMMAEIHYYTPYQFCLMTEDASWGKQFYYWGADYHSSNLTERNATWGEEETMEELFGIMKSQFVDKGIPVVLGEFAAIKRTNLTGADLELHLQSRAYYLQCVVKQARLNGLLPFYWDAGNRGENASALFNRQDNTVFDQQALSALMEGLN